MEIFVLLLLTNAAFASRLNSKISMITNKENFEPYIFGGRKATDGDAPWQVSIQDSETGNLKCGGSILTEHWVVSSQSCINGSTAWYKTKIFSF